MSVEGAEPKPPSLPLAGSVVGGKYLLERFLAEGGMGVIARGQHVELDEPVALKFPKPEIVAADSAGTVCVRFVREARATIKIRSEHVPRIFDVSTLPNGVPYIVQCEVGYLDCDLDPGNGCEAKGESCESVECPPCFATQKCCSGACIPLGDPCVRPPLPLND